MHEQIKSQRESQPVDAHMYQFADLLAGDGDESSDDSNFNSDGEPCSPIDERKNLQNLAKNFSLTMLKSGVDPRLPHHLLPWRDKVCGPAPFPGFLYRVLTQLRTLHS